MKILSQIACAAVAFFSLFLASQNVQAQGLIRDSEIERTLDKLTQPIFRAAGIGQDDVGLFILNNRSLNAFVAGGRSMFFHSGLLQTLETPEELLGVIAHESGHITSGHIFSRTAALEQARTQQRIAQIIGVLASVATRSVGGAAVAAGVGGIAQRDFLRFTRVQESGADQAALTFLNRAGIDPSGMLKVLQRLEQEQAIYLENVDPYALSHPLSRSRIRALELGVRKSPALGKRVSEELKYWHGRMRAKLDGFINDPSALSTTDYGSKELNLYREAIALFRLPNPDAAVSAMDELLKIRPQDPYYWELKGQILWESGRGPQAVAPYRKALELAPEHALIAAGLGRALLALQTKEADAEALKVLEQAAVQDQFDPGLRHSLAAAYARAGQDGMVAVANAERSALLGRSRDAKRHAERAKAMLPVGSPGWLRAEDILAISPRN